MVVTVALDGSGDVPIAERILRESGLALGEVYGQRGKDWLDERLVAYNHAAQFAHWFILRDLDRDAECAPELVARLLPKASALMVFRIAVRAAEAWLIADPERLARFLAVSAARLPRLPDSLPDPKQTVVTLARQSRARDVREDMVPRPGSGAPVGPGYASRIADFARHHWRPRAAARNSESLATCLAALDRLRRRSK